MSGLGETLYPPLAATAQASEIRGLYDIVFAFALAIFVIVEALILWSVFRYRRRKGDDTLPAQTHGNNLVEIIWTLVPTAIVLFLFVAYNFFTTKIDNFTYMIDEASYDQRRARAGPAPRRHQGQSHRGVAALPAREGGTGARESRRIGGRRAASSGDGPWAVQDRIR